MRATCIASVLSVVIMGGGVLFVGSARSDSKCDEATKFALTEVLKHMGVPGVDAAVLATDAMLEYVKNPDDKKLDAAMYSLGQGGASLAFPAYGIALSGGQIVVGGVNYTIDEAKSQQLEAFLCGTSSLGKAFTKVDFFSLTPVQAKSKGIDCHNFAERVTTLELLASYEAIWKGYYARHFLEMGGSANKDEFTKILYEGWTTLERNWKLRWAAIVYANLRAELERQAKAVALRKSCRGALPPGHVHLDLVKAVPDNNVMVGWEVTANRITWKEPNGAHAEFTWTPAPPEVIDAEFSLKLGVTSTSIAKNRLNAGIKVIGGFDKDPVDAHIEALSENGATATKSLTVTLKPPQALESWTTGQDLYLTVGADYGRSFTYQYQVHR